MLFDLERYEEAAITYDKITCLKSDDAATYYKKGEAFLRANRYEEALASFEQVIHLDPPQRLNPPQTIVLHKQGKALFGCRRYEEALAIFKKVISLFAVETVVTYSDEVLYIGEAYSEACDLFSSLVDNQEALNTLRQCYNETYAAFERRCMRIPDPDEEDYDIESDFTLLPRSESGDDSPDRDREPELGGHMPYDEDYEEW